MGAHDFNARFAFFLKRYRATTGLSSESSKQTKQTHIHTTLNTCTKYTHKRRAREVKGYKYRTTEKVKPLHKQKQPRDIFAMDSKWCGARVNINNLHEHRLYVIIFRFMSATLLCVFVVFFPTPRVVSSNKAKTVCIHYFNKMRKINEGKQTPVFERIY